MNGMLHLLGKVYRRLFKMSCYSTVHHNNGLLRICARGRCLVFTNKALGPSGLVHSLAQTAEAGYYKELSA
jgi:hypothetical protein